MLSACKEQPCPLCFPGEAKELAQLQGNPLAIRKLMGRERKIFSLSSPQPPIQLLTTTHAAHLGTTACYGRENHRSGLLEDLSHAYRAHGDVSIIIPAWNLTKRDVKDGFRLYLSRRKKHLYLSSPDPQTTKLLAEISIKTSFMSRR